MRKRELFVLFVLLIILFVSMVHSQTDQSEEQQKVSKAYSCLSGIVNNKTCSSLSTEEKIFSLLSLNKCKNELISDSIEDGKCWPGASGRCDLKKTAQAVLALSNAKQNTDVSQQWLLSQNKTPTELIWYLQIESSEPANCRISYSMGQSEISFTINIDEEKKIDSDAGSCLSRTSDNYWLEISSSPSCLNQEFVVSCNEFFLTNLLFKKTDSSTIHINSKSSSASAEGETREKINSLCFAQNGVCNYEGSLWTAFVLKTKGKEVSAFLPYLITLSQEEINQRFLPYSFLYYITSGADYKVSLLSKQIDDKWWSVSGNKFYDTALALYPLQKEELTEKTNAKNWLLDDRVQEQSGCWNSDNVVNTGFILASVWPKAYSGDSGTGAGAESCTQKGYYCVNSGTCQGQLSDYSCEGAISECCSIQSRTANTCSDLSGIKCSSNQECVRGNGVSSSDLNSGETCCVGGTCETRQQPVLSQCVEQKGECKTTCGSNEQESSLTCDYSGDLCCLQKTSQSSKNYTWLWILSILIVLVVLGIIFKDKLNEFLLKMSTSKGSGQQGMPSYRGPPPPHPPFSMTPSRMLPRQAERKIIPAQQYSRQIPPRQTSGTSKELDDVLKKLKEMGK